MTTADPTAPPAGASDTRPGDRELFIHGPLPMWILDADTLAFLDVNEAAVRHYGYSRDEFLGMSARDIRAPSDVPFLLAVLDSPNPVSEAVLARHQRSDGSFIWVEVASRRLTYQGRRARIALANDVTVRVEMEATIRQQREFFEQILENIDVDIAVFDRELRFEYVNPSSIRDPELRAWIIGRTNRDYCRYRGKDPSLAEKRDRSLTEAMEEGGRHGFEETISTAEGEPRHIIRSHLPVYGDDGELIRIIGYGFDQTDRVRAEEALRESEARLHRAQKMEAVGRLAGGVAHDFNNLLTAIGGYASLVLDGMEEDDPDRLCLEEIKAANVRAADLVRQLLAFSRKQVSNPTAVSLNEQVQRKETMLRQLLGEHTSLSIELDDALGHVMADPAQVDQVILNLALNARDAMPGGGKLQILTRLEDLPSPRGELAAGRYSVLSVTDTGCGMTEDTRSRVFEPFFTTKEPGKGTGLGLSVVYGIVQQSGGYAELRSRVGKGTTFRVYIPESAADASVAERSTPVRAAADGTETVLVVDDDAAVGRLFQQVLERKGYRVLRAEGGQEALDRAAAFEGEIHLLLTDVVMPEMNGRILAERLAAQRPATRVLFMSGHTEDSVLHHGVRRQGVRFLSKPASPGLVLERVRQTLDDPAVKPVGATLR